MAEMQVSPKDRPDSLRNTRSNPVTHGKLNADKDNSILYMHPKFLRTKDLDMGGKHMSGLIDKRISASGRRSFLTRVSALGATAAFGASRSLAAEPPPETTKLRLTPAPVICTAPMRIAEELLRLEGFTDIEYVGSLADPGPNVVAAGRADFTQWDVAALIPMLDAGAPILVLSGVHAGCQELFANDRVRTLRDLKGKRIAVSAMGNGDHIFISSILAYVGIDPKKEVSWITGSQLNGSMKLFTTGEADAFMAFAPEPQDLRRQKIGHTVLNLLEDKPWSQYFCCIVAGNREFVRANPAATKRVIRAMLKATEICANEPERAARYVVEKGHETRYDVALEIVKALPYRRWRDAHPEDTLRFHALRLHDVGMVKSTPRKLIAQGTDWRFLNELKKELKA
jgi:NitT/TauT family transport system substrate-binding protein